MIALIRLVLAIITSLFKSCLYRELHPGVLVVQAAENGHSEDNPERLYGTVDRAILV